ncbi:MAG TPA: cytochrome P450 [Polyangiaceae bacterium]|jgi:hypothetical protein|nr:cytochrome P450 [Polyangiaceae bacterium]
MSDSSIGLADLIVDADATIERARAVGAGAPTEIGVLVVKYEAVRELLQDRRVKTSFTELLHMFGITSGVFHDWIAISPLDMDGEEHRRWRSLMARTFTPRSVERLRPAFAQEARRLVAQFAAAGECEFVEAFARQLPSFGLAELIGVPTEDRGTFSGWADTVGLGMNLAVSASRIAEVDAALKALIDYCHQLLRERQQRPRDDLVTRMAQAADMEGGFTEAHLAASLAGLVFAGYETTKNQLGFMISTLAAVPEEWDRLAREPARAAKMVEECMRLRSTASVVGRLATEDLVVSGCPIGKGMRVLGSLWGGNRDPSVFRNPESFDPEAHEAEPQLAFGHGAHYCVGAALARAELQESLIALSSAITCPRVGEDAEWSPPLGISGPTRLPIAFTAR